MKLVVATIRTFNLEDVQEALTQIGITRFNVTEAKRFGRQKGIPLSIAAPNNATGFLPKKKVEVVVSDNLVDKVVDTIARSVRTSKPSDGEIIVTCIDRKMGILTGKMNFEAK